MAGLVPAIPKAGTPCLPERDRRDKPGDDRWTASTFAPVTGRVRNALISPHNLRCVNPVTFTLLERAPGYWMSLDGEARRTFRFIHVSTDEVYGSLGADGLFRETPTILR